MQEPALPDAAEATLAYHERSKHHPRRFAASLGYLDWETQPDPFRTYAGAPRLELPLAADRLEARWPALFAAGAVPAHPFTLPSIGAFFELSLGLTAWKRSGDARWALRANPSSGNLHPTEGWLLSLEEGALPAGAHHYVSRDHALERRVSFARPAAPSCDRGFGVALTSIHWRESWKYGERAFRYCQHDVGHALAALRLAAAALGWRARLIDTLGDEVVARLLGLDRDDDFTHLDVHDREHPEALLWIATDGRDVDVEAVAASLRTRAASLEEATFSGRANALSSAHFDWPAIAAAADATCCPPSPAPMQEASAFAPFALPRQSVSARAVAAVAATLIRARRSAVAFDPKPSLAAADFFALLDATLARPDAAPFDGWPDAPPLHLALMVHRVEGVAPGLYLLERGASENAEVEPSLRAAIGGEAAWSRVAIAPTHLRLFLLREGDFRDSARIISCRQEIAADGAFSLGMLSAFEPLVRAAPHRYRRLFWNAGFVGQQLYLAAEAAGVRATGIGCYFDDLFHELLGLRDRAFQSLYHFTVGVPIDDARLGSEPPYGSRGAP